MANLFNPPPVYALPVSLGGDIIVEFNNVVPDSDPVTYEDYPVGATVTLAIGKGESLVTSAAVITGHTAACRIQSAVADTIKAGALWRCIIHTTGLDDVVAMNGKVVRADGN